MAVPADVLTTPCAKSAVTFRTVGDILDAYQIRDADFEMCAAKVKGIGDYLKGADPKVIPAPVPKSRPFNFKPFNRAKPKKVTT